MNSNTPPISSQPQFLSLAISEITLDDTINTRPINYEIAAEYREAMLAYGVDSWQDHWNELPRITASKHLFSGFHTVTAVKVAFGAGPYSPVCCRGRNLPRTLFFLRPALTPSMADGVATPRNSSLFCGGWLTRKSVSGPTGI